MSFEHVWPQMRALGSQGDEAPPPVSAAAAASRREATAWACPAEAAQPELEWKILYPFRARPLLVPTGAPAQARAAVALFVDNRLLRVLGYLFLRVDRLLAGRVLPTARLDEFPAALLFGSDGGPGVPYAAQFGSPGPLSKLAVFSPGDGDAPGQVAKIALDPSADQSVHREAYWLRMLGNTPAADFLPELLRHGVLPCGRAFITTTVVPRGAPGDRFGGAHREFLALLARISLGAARWSASSGAERLRQRIGAIADLLGADFRSTCDAVLLDIERRMHRRTVPACLVHGDFAAWNLRLAAGRLYVFDWEYAEANGNPLQDFLHFHLIARATHGRKVGSAYMQAVLARAAQHGREIFGRESGVAEAAPTLALHYLLDLLTFYVEASRRLDTGHVVVRSYLRLLDERTSWLPPQPSAR